MKVAILFRYPVCAERLLYAQHFDRFQKDNTRFLCYWQDSHSVKNHTNHQDITEMCAREVPGEDIIKEEQPQLHSQVRLP